MGRCQFSQGKGVRLLMAKLEDCPRENHDENFPRVLSNLEPDRPAYSCWSLYLRRHPENGLSAGICRYHCFL